jgi:hypothetical protein
MKGWEKKVRMGKSHWLMKVRSGGKTQIEWGAKVILAYDSPIWWANQIEWRKVRLGEERSGGESLIEWGKS